MMKDCHLGLSKSANHRHPSTQHFLIINLFMCQRMAHDPFSKTDHLLAPSPSFKVHWPEQPLSKVFKNVQMNCNNWWRPLLLNTVTLGAGQDFSCQLCSRLKDRPTISHQSRLTQTTMQISRTAWKISPLTLEILFTTSFNLLTFWYL